MAGLKKSFFCGDGTDGLEQVGFGAILEEIALGAGSECAYEKGLVAVHA